MTASLKQQKVEQTSVGSLDLADKTPELVASQERSEPVEGGGAGLGKGRGQCCSPSWAARVVRFATFDALKSKTVAAFDIGRDCEPTNERVRVDNSLNLQGKAFMPSECHAWLVSPPQAHRPPAAELAPAHFGQRPEHMRRTVVSRHVEDLGFIELEGRREWGRWVAVVGVHSGK